MPYLRAAVSYRLADGKKAAVFVVDPKRELRQSSVLEACDPDRLVVLGECGSPVRFISLDCPLSMTDRRRKIDALLPLQAIGQGAHAYWHENSMAKVYELMTLQQETDKRMSGLRLFNEWALELELETESRNSWVVLKAILQRVCAGGRPALKQACVALRKVCQTHGVRGPATDALDMYTAGEDAFVQFVYVVTCATPLLTLLADPNLQRFVELDPVPDPQIVAVNIAELVEAGKVILIQPDNKDSSRIAAMAVKGRLHEAVFSRKDQARPVITVVDEFQRFISNDTETGEQAYLDRCRGYRGMALYATQSLASLEHALGADHAARAAIHILLANTPTKIIMRTTDEATVNWLRAVLPGPPVAGLHVVDVHRPAGFGRGQGYVMQANGRWAMRQATLA
jgi:hypothetical protein